MPRSPKIAVEAVASAHGMTVQGPLPVFGDKGGMGFKIVDMARTHGSERGNLHMKASFVIAPSEYHDTRKIEARAKLAVACIKDMIVTGWERAEHKNSQAVSLASETKEPVS